MLAKVKLLTFTIALCGIVTLSLLLKFAYQDNGSLKANQINLQLQNNLKSAQIEGYIAEQQAMSSLLSERATRQNREREELKREIKVLRKELDDIECFDVSYPDAVIERMHEPY